MSNLDRKLDRLLDATGRDQGDEGSSLDPSRLDVEELREAEQLLRVGKGMPRLTPIQQADAQAREEGRLSSQVSQGAIQEDDRQMMRRTFDPDRLSPEEQERLGKLFEKMEPAD